MLRKMDKYVQVLQTITEIKFYDAAQAQPRPSPGPMSGLGWGFLRAGAHSGPGPATSGMDHGPDRPEGAPTMDPER